MKPEEYIKNRLDDQLNWYDKKSTHAQKKFKGIRTLEIIFAALIPVLSVIRGGTEDFDPTKIIIAALGGAIVVLAGLNALNKYQELWTSYRTVAETLKHHKFLFETQSTPYNRDDAFNNLVENVEAIISREHSNWSSMLKKQQKK